MRTVSLAASFRYSRRSARKLGRYTSEASCRGSKNGSSQLRAKPFQRGFVPWPLRPGPVRRTWQCSDRARGKLVAARALLGHARTPGYRDCLAEAIKRACQQRGRDAFKLPLADARAFLAVTVRGRD